VDLERYHATRSLAHQPFRSACYAPFVGLSFDMHGAVSVCSFTRSTPLGWVGEQPLQDMWRGAVAVSLRDAVRRDDLDAYCTRCAEEIEGGNLHGALSVGFDRFRVGEQVWPTRMEFALSNACNLQCVMCSGEFSSAIRSRREGLPPLSSPYDDEFLDQLRPFLVHLEQARFLGGEPFLAEVNFRIWDLLVAEGSPAEVNLTTNGTVWNRRVEQLLEALPFSIGVSVDGFRAETVEAIRVGASHARIMATIDRLLSHRDRTGASVSLTYCLMVENWSEFGDFLRFAEDRGCRVYVNTVRQPPRHSLYRLPTAELARIVRELQEEGRRLAGALELNRTAWDEQLERLQHELDDRGAPGRDATERFRDRWQALADAVAAPGLDEGALLELLADAATSPPALLRCDAEDRIVEGSIYAGVDVSHLVGGSSRRVVPHLAQHLGHRTDIVAECTVPGVQVRVVEFGAADRPTTVVALVNRLGPEDVASTRIAAVLAVGREPGPAGVTVATPVRRVQAPGPDAAASASAETAAAVVNASDPQANTSFGPP
jgi:MoaA/NifB/PqqE/SkfB family radical SAM enzyme